MSQLTTYYHTPDFQKLDKKAYKFFVISTRDPLDRTLSAFAYMHPRNLQVRGEERRWIFRSNKFYKNCFPNMDTFVEALSRANITAGNEFGAMIEKPSTLSCTDRARAAWQHQVLLVDHFHWDHQHLERQMRPRYQSADVALLLVRREALWEDWTSTNHWLEQNATTVETFPEVHMRAVAGTAFPVGKDISEPNRGRLCLLLRSEYQVYLEMVALARNLNEEEKLESLKFSQRQCPELNLTFFEQ